MKIVLCAMNGSWSHTNLAIRCLRPPLEREGFSVVLKEYTLRDRTAHVLEDLVNEAGDVYGFSCYIWNIEQMLSLSHALRQVLPQCKIIFGGPEVSFHTERFHEANQIDGIICGEGETAFSEICKAISENRPFPRITKASPSTQMPKEGILYRDGENTGGILYYESSRGCPFSCAYCLSCTETQLRMKSVEETLCDLKAFEALNTNCKIIKFVDRTFNADKKRANAIWQALLSPDYTKHYHFEICASLLNEESFAILSRFPKGKIQLEIGLQSTHLPTLEASARHIDPRQVISATRRIHDMGNIHVHLDLIAGLPYEGYDRFGQSFDEAYGSCDMLQLGFLKLLYGTPLREKADQYGYAFLKTPPYTVLKSHWISFAELQKLSHMAETMERYFESGRFAHTLFYITPYMTSPFGFWEGLTHFLRQRDQRPLQRIAQQDAYRYFLEYTANTLPVDKATLKTVMGTDFTQSENKQPPAFLRG